MAQPLLSSNDELELDEPWDEDTLKMELKYLKSYQRQEKELYGWLKTGGFAVLEKYAPYFGLDMDNLTVEAVYKVPNMPKVVRAGFLEALKWWTLRNKVMQLAKYQAQQKHKNPYGTWSRWLHAHAQEVF